MGWKSIEMQVALPRTTEAGRIQENMTKQNQHFQDSLNQLQIKQQELKRKKVNESENTYRVKDKKEESKQYPDEDSSEKQIVESHIDHPFLGKKIDFNG